MLFSFSSIDIEVFLFLFIESGKIYAPPIMLKALRLTHNLKAPLLLVEPLLPSPTSRGSPPQIIIQPIHQGATRERTPAMAGH